MDAPIGVSTEPYTTRRLAKKLIAHAG